MTLVLSQLGASSGSGEAVRGLVTILRSPGATVITPNSMVNYPSEFVITTGPLLANGTLDPAMVLVARAHSSGTTIVIDELAPGYVDNGSAVGDVVVIKPTTWWADTILDALTTILKDDKTFKDNVISTEAMFADAVDPVLRSKESLPNYIASGGLWTGDAYGSTRAASMTALVAFINGQRGTISAVAARLFTASRDTYIDILNTAGVFTLVYTEVSNNAASPALAANSIRLGVVVTGASNIAASTSIGQGGFANTVPVISSQILRGFDTLGNLIYPKSTTVGGQIKTKFSVYRINAQNSVNGFVKVALDTKVYDTDNSFDLVNNRLVAKVPGFYHFSGAVSQGAAAASVWQANLYKNGVVHKSGSLVNVSTNFQSSQVSGDVQMAVGDYIELFIYANAAVAIGLGSVSTYLDGHLISAS